MLVVLQLFESLLCFTVALILCTHPLNCRTHRPPLTATRRLTLIGIAVTETCGQEHGRETDPAADGGRVARCVRHFAEEIGDVHL